MAYASLIAGLCLLPGKRLPRLRFLDFPQADKLVHFCLFGILGGLICWAADVRCRHRQAVLAAILAAVAYGAILEALQHVLLPHDRCFAWGDIGANAIGVAFFAGSYLWLRRRTDRAQ
jgi:hypothetical protein